MSDPLEVSFVPSDDLEHELDNVVIKLKNELRQMNWRIKDLEKKLKVKEEETETIVIQNEDRFKALSAEIKRNEELLKGKENELKTLKEKNSRENHYLQTMLKENQEHIKRLEEDIQSMNTDIKELNVEHSKENEKLKFELNETKLQLKKNLNAERLLTNELKYKIENLKQENTELAHVLENTTKSLRSETEEKTTELDSTSSQNKCLREENEKLKKNNKDLQQDISQLCEARAAIIQKDIANQEDIFKYKTEIAELQKRISTLENDLRLLDQQHTASKKENERLKRAMERKGETHKLEIEKELKKTKTKIEEITKIEKKLAKIEREKEKADTQISNDKKFQKSQLDQINQLIYQNKQAESQHEQSRNKLQHLAQEERKNFLALSSQYNQVLCQKEVYFEQVRALEAQKKQLEAEKSNLLLRLSKLAGANLTLNNPNIADLSDEKRPTKLAEEFSELYDNEWTDAFEEIQIENEEQKTNFMLELLMRANQICQDLSTEHIKKIKHSLSALTLRLPAATPIKQKGHEVHEDSGKSRNIPSAEINHTESEVDSEKIVQKDPIVEIKDIQNGAHSDAENKISSETEDDSKVFENRFKALAEEEQEISDGNSTAEKKPYYEDSTECKQENYDENENQEISDGNSTAEKKPYYEDSTESKQENYDENENQEISDGNSTAEKKPYYEDSTESKQENYDENENQTDQEQEAVSPDVERGDTDSENRDRRFERTNPEASQEHEDTIRLESDFELLRNEQKKTISEARTFFELTLGPEVEKAGTEIIVQEKGINKDKQQTVVNYIKKCINVCWSMCRHEPPVHVDFPDVAGDIPFDTDEYKPYKKTGKQISYVVWPALYLYEGGPMLFQGVAEGK